MNKIRRYRFLAMALAVCVAGATAPCALMAQGSPGFAAYGHSHKKHKKSEVKSTEATTKTEAKKDMKKEDMSKQEMAKKSESKWHKTADSKKMETKKAETQMMGQKPPHPGMVWVNTNTKVYHSAGSKYYGNTKHGKWMTPAEAQKAGYKASKN